ncbi:MAG: hypothetical protein GDA56_03960 [Hormoscilla sp. GM7CHS1pb]|nr:hypothetical protein [Hormoscilla sp. GM7CHS1pb]
MARRLSIEAVMGQLRILSSSFSGWFVGWLGIGPYWIKSSAIAKTRATSDLRFQLISINQSP